MADGGDAGGPEAVVTIPASSLAPEAESPAIAARKVETVSAPLPAGPAPDGVQPRRAALEPQPIPDSPSEDEAGERTPTLFLITPEPCSQSAGLRAAGRLDKAAAPPRVRKAWFPSAGEDPGRRNQNLASKTRPATFVNAAHAANPFNSSTHSKPVSLSADKACQPVRMLWKPEPRYPQEALRRRLEGDVVVDVEFRYSGTLEVLGVARSPDPAFVETALEAIRKLRFVPARKDGRAVDQQTRLRVRFRLG